MERKIRNIIVEMRIWQWAKNVLVFAPIIFSTNLLNTPSLLKVLGVFGALSFAASSVYVLNDIFDIKIDRLHPKKKLRPIASNKINIKTGYLLSAVLLIISLILSYFMSWNVLLIIAGYYIANLIYSRYLKHIVILDILVVAIFYLLRVYLGGVVINVPISGWLLLTTLFLSLFVIIGKRRAEYVNCENLSAKTRKVLEEYNKGFLDGALIVSLTLSIAFYSLYSITNHSYLFSASIIIVIYASLRYLYLVYVKNSGEEPEKLLFKDKPLFFSGVAFALLLMAIIYLPILMKK